MIKIDSLPLSKAYCNGGIKKAVLNGSVLYESAPQLDAPTNLSVTDTTASFDPVENAESYEFFVDDVSIGEYSTQTGYTVSISTTGDPVGTAFDVYDGIYPSGTRLGDLYGSDVTPIDFIITSGNISFAITGSDESIVSYSSTGGVSNFVVNPNVQCPLKADVSGDGTITLELYQR